MGLHGRMHAVVPKLAIAALFGSMQMNFAHCIGCAEKHCLSAGVAAAAAAPGSAMQAMAERRDRTSIGAIHFHTFSMCDESLFGGCEDVMRLRGGKAKSKNRWKYIGDKAMNWTSVDQMQVRMLSPPLRKSLCIHPPASIPSLAPSLSPEHVHVYTPSCLHTGVFICTHSGALKHKHTEAAHNTHTYIHTYIHSYMQSYMHAFIQTDIHTVSQSVRQTDRQTDRQTKNAHSMPMQPTLALFSK